IQSISVEHEKGVNATVGQNISLPCIMPEKHSKIVQLQWHKEGKQGQKKLVIFNPTISTYFYANVTLKLVPETNTTDIRGSILHLQQVTEEDSGEYICDIASFPDGSIKTSTKVQITVPKVSMTVMPTNRTIIEGDTVSITCVSNPIPDKYLLSSSLNQSGMESLDGKFIIQNITRHIRDLICQPVWSLSNQHLQGLSANEQLTVEFLEDIQCKSKNQIQVESGTNLTINCEAKSSMSLHFVWKKDNMTVSSGASLNLSSVSPDDSGNYTLTVHTKILNLLPKQKDFTITVIKRTYIDHLSSTITMETTPQTSSTAMTTSHPIVTTPTSLPPHTSSATNATTPEEDMYISTSTPSTGNTTMVHASVTTPYMDVNSSATTFTVTASEDRTQSEVCCTSIPGSTSRVINYTHPDTSTVIFTTAFTSKATVGISSVLTNEIIRNDVNTSKSHMVFVIIPVLLLLLLIGFLYHQYCIQK
ncbi:T-cell surface protein tactile-like, partial [Clarias magur]